MEFSMNKIVKTETSHPHSNLFSFWLKHYFEDGTWVAIFTDGEHMFNDFGGYGTSDGHMCKDVHATWDLFHGRVSAIIGGEMKIVLMDDDPEGNSYHDETWIQIVEC